MFRAVYLGHNGWLASAGRTHVLFDPLLHERFGAADTVGLRVYPPRRIELDSFPPPAAVVLTHEHEDHFDVATLALIAREVPIYLPARSSIALRTFLGEMGFRVRLLRPGKLERIGALELLPMTPDQVHQGTQEEWDVLPFLVRDRAGHGSLFSHVDMAPSHAMWQAARRLVDAPGLWAYTCNNTSLHFAQSGRTPHAFELARFAEFVTRYHETLTARWAHAAAVLVVGASFAFGRERAWLNHNAFSWTSEDAVRALSPLFKEPVIGPLPGEVFSMRRGRLVRREPRTRFLEVAPRRSWPRRDFRGDVAWLAEFAPATRRRRLPKAEIAELARELDEFAAHMYAGDAFRKLHSLDESALGGVRPTLALALFDGVSPGARRSGNLVFEYRPEACAFRRVASTAPRRAYLVTYECWASDLLAFLRCELSPTALYFGHSRSYVQNGLRFGFDLNHALFEYVHPLRQPQRCLERYRRLLREVNASGIRPALGSRRRAS